MVYGFVRQSRGHVKISSEVGRGTAVRIHLPRSIAERPDEAASERPAEPHGTENILLVEDDAKVRASVAEQLCILGYRVTEAANSPPPWYGAGRRSGSSSCRATPMAPTSFVAGSIPTSCCSTSPSTVATWHRSCGWRSTVARVLRRPEAGNPVAASTFAGDGPASQDTSG
jgi:hypothetical protein